MYNMCNQVSYYAHLYNSLLHNKHNSLVQKAQLGEWISNIEGYDYETSIELWYSQLFDIIESMLPEFYVKTLIVYENDLGTVKSISYTYHDKSVNVQDIANTSIVMHREKTHNDSASNCFS